jgi:ribosome-binding protein aMBF1 (putative translation factor)
MSTYAELEDAFNTPVIAKPKPKQTENKKPAPKTVQNPKQKLDDQADTLMRRRNELSVSRAVLARALNLEERIFRDCETKIQAINERIWIKIRNELDKIERQNKIKKASYQENQ